MANQANQANPANPANPANQVLGRKPYSSPVVHDYGNFHAITKAVGITSVKRDAPGGGNNKTR